MRVGFASATVSSSETIRIVVPVEDTETPAPPSAKVTVSGASSDAGLMDRDPALGSLGLRVAPRREPRERPRIGLERGDAAREVRRRAPQERKRAVSTSKAPQSTKLVSSSASRGSA